MADVSFLVLHKIDLLAGNEMTSQNINLFFCVREIRRSRNISHGFAVESRVSDLSSIIRRNLTTSGCFRGPYGGRFLLVKKSVTKMYLVQIYKIFIYVIFVIRRCCISL